LRIAIVGAGVAGSYLLKMLSNEHDVTAFEAQGEGDYRSICAWGAPKHPMREFASKAGLSFDEYILHEGKYFTMIFGGTKLDIPLTGLSTFDKEKFLADLRRGGAVRYGSRVARGQGLDGYDLVVDATGFHRILVGRPSREVAIPTLEFMVKYREMPFDDFYAEVFPGLTGYIWFFPLSHGVAHVGSGDFGHRHVEMLSEFLSRYPPEEVLRKVGRPVRLASPEMSAPIRIGNVLAIGEAAGVVFPTTGEGIVPSLQSAEVLRNVLDAGNLDDFERSMRRSFRLHDEVGRVFLDGLLRGRRDPGTILRLLRLAARFRSMDERFGLRPGILQLVGAMIGGARPRPAAPEIRS
jgi:flavin-dependent dehydrogenase